MSGFEPLELKWGGRTYAIQPHRMMGALQKFERAMTPQDFTLLAQGAMGAAPAVCSGAYGSLLRYAGARDVSDTDIFEACREEHFTGEKSMAVIDTLLELQVLHLPSRDRERIKAQIEDAASDPEREAEAAERAAKEPDSENPTQTPPASSKQPSRQRSAADG